MDTFKILLIIHIACGGISLILGLYIMLAAKGNTIHKKVGNLYHYAMLISAVVALPMSYLHSNFFLFIVGVFTSYMLLTGKRYLNIKTIADVKTIDWFWIIVMLLFALAFLGCGVYLLINHNNIGIVLIVFGFISLNFVKQDYNNFTSQSTIKNFYLTTHIQRMVGSYIATVTAFVVVNNSILPGVIAWLLPTVCLVPFTVKWTKKYKIDVKKGVAN